MSGGVTDIRATSSRIFFDLNKSGISHRNMGRVSALPSFTALRALEARNNEFDLKIPEMEEKNLE